MNKAIALVIVCVVVGGLALTGFTTTTSTVEASGPDTGQDQCYDLQGNQIPCPEPGEALFGQDANYVSAAPAYRDNGDGTISDLNTGLMWTQAYSGKMTWTEAMAGADSFELAGYDDWRMPTIKELYSLIDFNGLTGMEAASSIPYIDTDYFEFVFGDTSAGERLIDAQYWSSTEYVSTTMNGNHTVFGVNFADGRIKGYGTSNPRGEEMTQFVRYVRGPVGYGANDFVDNGDGTITDNSTGLMWMQADSGTALDWAGALDYCENLSFAGYDDWRLPDAKELQYIVDYTRSPDTTGSAAIDPLFSATPITDEGGATNYAFYWTGTTHLDGRFPGDRAVYVAFGEALGHMSAPNSSDLTLMDVHGAGAQRSDMKSGDPDSVPVGFGPQGDVQRILNFARCVRGGEVTIFTGGEIDANWNTTRVQEGGPPADGAGFGQAQQGQMPSDGQVPQGGPGQGGQPPQGGGPPQGGPGNGNPPPRQ
ncbi:MAG: DUF1566 domain-containing protein [Chloroflexi bacterium]|nr:DUF1566 domain-containing protein [Chloroflexota bacterium]